MAMNCGQAGDLGARIVSGNGSAADQAELQKHLLTCLPCRENHARLQKVWKLMGGLPQVVPSPVRSRETLARATAVAPRRLYWIAGAAAAALLAIGAFAILRSPEIPTDVSRSTPPPPKHVLPEEPRREEVERNRVEQLLEEKSPKTAVEPVTPPVPAPAPAQVADPSPAPPTPKPDVAPPAPQEPKAIVKQDAPPVPAPSPDKPAPATRETTPPAGTLDRVEGSVLIVVAGTKSPAKAGQVVPEGAGLETSGSGSQAVLEYADGSRVALGADTVLTQIWDRRTPAGKPAEGKLIQISQGMLAAQVARQPAGEPMIFATPHAEARVLGTRLSLTIAAASTRLDVRQGRVKLTRREDGASAEVGEGKFAMAGKGIAPAPKAAPSPKIILFEPFDRAKWNAALAPGGDASTGLRFSTETGALSIQMSQKAPPDVTPGLVTPPGVPNGSKVPPEVSKKAIENVTRGVTGAKSDLPRALWLETRQTFAFTNDAPLRIRARLWQSNSDADRATWMGVNRGAGGLLLERRGGVLQLWSEAAQSVVWKKDLACVQDWESVELWLSKDQVIVRRNDLTVHAGPNPLKVKVVQLSFGGNAKAELAQDSEIRFDDLELSWTTKSDLEDVTR